MVDFAELITNVIASGASDLHLSVGAPPVMRLNGELVRIGDKPLTSQDTRELVYGLLNQAQRQVGLMIAERHSAIAHRWTQAPHA